MGRRTFSDTAIRYDGNGCVLRGNTEIGFVKQVRFSSRKWSQDAMAWVSGRVLGLNEKPLAGEGKSHYEWIPVPAGMETESDADLAATFGSFENKGDAVRVVARFA
jgi:hypothetical protein